MEKQGLPKILDGNFCVAGRDYPALARLGEPEIKTGRGGGNYIADRRGGDGISGVKVEVHRYKEDRRRPDDARRAASIGVHVADDVVSAAEKPVPVHGEKHDVSAGNRLAQSVIDEGIAGMVHPYPVEIE